MDIPQLISQLAAGDDTAGPILVSMVAPRLLGYADLIASDVPLPDREAAVEAAIERAVRRIDHFDPMKGTFPGWVRTFVRHAIGDWRRDNPQGPAAALDLVREPANRPTTVAAGQSDYVSHAIAALLSRLPEVDQLLVRLRFDEGLSHGQIAEQLHVSEAACRKRLERILQRLRAGVADVPELSHLKRGEQA